MPAFETITPNQLLGHGEAGQWPIEQYALRFLAQGDSWFSIGSFPFFATTNLFEHMGTSRRGLVVNCARPGATLAHMTDLVKASDFQRLLCGSTEFAWDGLLLSGLGNDVIDALSSQSPDPKLRLLNPAAEWGPEGSPLRYVSEPGWQTFEQHARDVYANLLAMRARSRFNRNVPIITHTYDLATPRNAGAAPAIGPWLYKALGKTYGVPEHDWIGLATEFLRRVADLILDIQSTTPHMHVVSTQQTLTAALTTDAGPTPHWANEIHPSPAGYELLAQRWNPQLDQLYP
ncbi:hypothetical protein [Variovorax sp.]|uniref:hypothetical protein n=1 Tax=Variovorax sp. TaxID=1871043 RepID=UPI002D6ABB76|nr:hypothetical protein [Variovorax sp.]HYP84292.1 hypothetical protein [Variovorax sp.]